MTDTAPEISDKRVRVFTCTDHDSVWPVGVASVVVANNEYEAKTLLFEELKKTGLHKTPFSLQEVDLTAPKAIVLQNGDY